MKKVFGILAVAGLAMSANAAIVIVPCTSTFMDISATGTSPGSATDDSEHTITGAALTAAGFTGNELLAGGVDIIMGNNGGVIWNASVAANTTSNQVGFTNADILTMAPGNLGSNGNGNNLRQFIAPLWDDHFPSSGNGNNALDWQVIGGTLILQWSLQDHFAATGTGTVTFQMKVHSGVTIASGLPLVEFVYLDTFYATGATQNDGGSASIGYKNWGINPNANDVQWAFNTLGSVTGSASNGGGTGPSCLAIIPAPGTVALAGLAGLFAARRRRA